MDIIQAYQSGKTLRAIAAEVGVTHETVRNRLIKAGVALRPVSVPVSPDVLAWLDRAKALRVGQSIEVDGIGITIRYHLRGLSPKRFSVGKIEAGKKYRITRRGYNRRGV